MPTQKITMGRDRDTDYQAKLQAAKKGSDAQNNYMWGLQSADPKYGNNNMPTNDAADLDGNFSQIADTAGNIVMTDPGNQTGFLAGSVSSTIEPQVNPREMGQDAEARVAALQSGRQFQGYNNRQQIYGA